MNYQTLKILLTAALVVSVLVVLYLVLHEMDDFTSTLNACFTEGGAA